MSVRLYLRPLSCEVDREAQYVKVWDELSERDSELPESNLKCEKLNVNQLDVDDVRALLLAAALLAASPIL